MARGDEQPPTIEDIFNARLEQLLEARGLTYQDLLERLEKADYTSDVPATVLLNDAVAMAAVLDVSVFSLLVPDGGEAVAMTPSIEAKARDLDLWLRGYRPLTEQDQTVFNAHIADADLDADNVAELWVWAERLRTAGLAVSLQAAVAARDRRRVKKLVDLAQMTLDQAALIRADDRIQRTVTSTDLEAAVRRANRFLRQAFAR